jgi:hypothetical protein
MAKPSKKSNNYFERRNKSEELSGQKTYNLQQSFVQSLGGKTDYEMATPLDAQDFFNREAQNSQNEIERKVEEPYSIQTAPTLSPENKRTPRAEKIAYSPSKEQLVIKFYQGPWWHYNGVSREQWSDLKSSPSTGGWLHENGFNSWSDMGPFDPSEMSRQDRVMFNS